MRANLVRLVLSLACVVGVLSAAAGSSAQRMITIGPAGSIPHGAFASGWRAGAGIQADCQWTYVRSFEAAVTLTVLNHLPKEVEDPEVLLGVWTLGVHWKPHLTRTLALDTLFGAEHHTAVFHDGWEKHEGTKGYNESDLGACVGVGLEKTLSPRWRLAVGVRTHVLFTEPERVRYETVTVGLAR